MLVEWVSIENKPFKPWRINTSFMLSTYLCIFGKGCPGTGHTTNGCCGSGYTFDKEEIYDINDNVKLLTKDDLQIVDVIHEFMDKSKLKNSWKVWGQKVVTEDGSSYYNSLTTDRYMEIVDHTSNKDAACIFFNRVPGNEGCAFHRMAIRTEQHFTETKPVTCWTAPLHIEEHDTENVLSVMTNYTWGENKYAPLSWWCTDSNEERVYTSSDYVFDSMCNELVSILGRTIYQQLREHCLSRLSERPQAIHKSRKYIPIVYHE